MTQNEFEEMLKNLMKESLTQEEINLLDSRYGLTGPSASLKKLEKTTGVPASQLRKAENQSLDKICASPSFSKVASKLEGENLDDFAICGLSGFYLLALQLLNH